MKYIFVLTIVFSLHLSAYNLQEIRESLKSNSKTKSLELNRDSLISESSLINTYSAPVLGASLSHAKDPINSGLEYSVGVSQDIITPFASSSKSSAVEQSVLAIKQETKHQLHIIELDVSSKYYAACSSKEMQEQAGYLFEEQSKRYKQLKYAYELGEISKKDLLFNRLNLAKLRQNISRYKLVYLDDLLTLQESVDSLKIESVSCNDLIEPQLVLHVRDINEHGELKTLEYKRSASKALYNMHDSMVQNIGYELLFEQELETKRYTAGISIPLGGISGERELLKAQELSMSSSYEFEKESMKHEIKNSTKKLTSKLELMFNELSILKDEILPLNRDLLHLSKSALQEGEGTIMEYIDASRSYSENLLGMLELKKTYYYELFELYKIADMEYGEEK